MSFGNINPKPPGLTNINKVINTVLQSAPNLQINPNNLNNGTGATSLTFYRGDGVWDVPPANDFTGFASQTITTDTSLTPSDINEIIYMDGGIGLTVTLPDISTLPNPVGASVLLSNISVDIAFFQAVDPININTNFLFQGDFLWLISGVVDGTNTWQVVSYGFTILQPNLGGTGNTTPSLGQLLVGNSFGSYQQSTIVPLTNMYIQSGNPITGDGIIKMASIDPATYTYSGGF